MLFYVYPKLMGLKLATIYYACPNTLRKISLMRAAGLVRIFPSS
jgi:hypothetical protein